MLQAKVLAVCWAKYGWMCLRARMWA